MCNQASYVGRNPQLVHTCPHSIATQPVLDTKAKYCTNQSIGALMSIQLPTAHVAARSKNKLIVVRPTKSTVFTKFVGRLRVAPQQQARLSLGVYGTGRHEKGFSVELKPTPDPDESVVTQVFSIGSSERHELVLNIANYGDRTVTADVWQM